MYVAYSLKNKKVITKKWPIGSYIFSDSTLHWKIVLHIYNVFQIKKKEK